MESNFLLKRLCPLGTPGGPRYQIQLGGNRFEEDPKIKLEIFSTFNLGR